MMTNPHGTCTAFAGTRRIASGPLETVALAAKAALDRGEASLVILDDGTCRPVEMDLRGTAADVAARLEYAAREASAPVSAPRGPGRPKLGVVAREVTLLPRHWEWLNSQPGGASVALRRIVDEARRANGEKDRVRQAQEALYRFMSTLAGDQPGFEEAARALFAGRRDDFAAIVRAWPGDLGTHALDLSAAAFGTAGAQG